ncbi:four helix bundle protein [Pseudochryseolinea flava]|uniref:Four helix bundle protein n=1 Tax=Pseudochryseolinea flava TaxID=2059302 RepID=A0A364Y7G9_9BACT|nr:four helix bundle protein [Pseudochryseolinea flava]RAW03021.1 four helix bundle protein [Pseudochryseolinea flava]
MQKSKSFKELVVWQRAHQLVLSVYGLTKVFPREELFCLTQQYRRAAVSIAANIVEGYRKRTKPEKIRFLNIAQASLEECKYYALLSNDLGYADTIILQNSSEETSKLLDAYIKAIEASS